ncbi:MAG: universal stress protein [Rubrivivax sp.]|nr:MAG: universal stress protein [Rubrivivax sp.]
MFEHLLVPVDGSELSEKAITTSIGMAKMLGASITGFIVETPLPPVVVEPVAVAYYVETSQEHQQQCEAHAREVLEAFARRAVEAGVTFDGQFMITDNIQQAIVETAQRQECDLIVMVSHGRHGLDALINGSLTKSVLSHSKVPLLVLH